MQLRPMQISGNQNNTGKKKTFIKSKIKDIQNVEDMF